MDEVNYNQFFFKNINNKKIISDMLKMVIKMVQKELFGSFKNKDHGLCMRNSAWGQKSGKSAPFGAESGNPENPPEWDPCA